MTGDQKEFHQEAGNPPANSLPNGLDARSLLDAVEESGYPLQAKASDIIGDAFDAPETAAIYEEWRYIDQDSGQPRALDIRASVGPLNHALDPRVEPFLELLVECKRSELPWVFFCRPGSGHTISTPRIAGLPSDTIAISGLDGFTTLLPALQVLGLISDPFVLDAAPTATNFVRARRKGKRLELSGDQAWSQVTLPLLKAAEHLISTATPPSTWRKFDARLVIPIAVLDAPMVTVTMDGDESRMTHSPWIRVERFESLAASTFYRRPLLSMFDVVHIEYLTTYLSEVDRYGKKFAASVLSRQEVLAGARGIDQGLGHKVSFDPDRVRPPHQLDGVTRAAAIAADLGRDAARLVLPFLGRRRPPSERWANIYSRGQTAKPKSDDVTSE